jgi:predicted dehydrogenase
MTAPVEPVRLGILGAARIAERAIVKPAHATGTRLVVIGARDPQRAEAFARQHGVERSVGSYAEVLEATDVEAIYNPLPNAFHGPWNLAAIHAGKHVLSEKPFASNAEEAAAVHDAARGTALSVVEGFHYLYHPIMQRLLGLVASGELGELVRVEATILMAAPAAQDPRWSLALAGGVLMDLGCYGLHAHRSLAAFAGGEPSLVAARAGERAGTPGVDEWLDADLAFPSGATGSVRCNMASERREMSLRVIGSRGQATAMDFIEPHLDDRLVVETPAGAATEHLGTRSSYTYQLEAFIAALRGGPAMVTSSADSVLTMQLIDECYRAAGLQPRPRISLQAAGRSAT